MSRATGMTFVKIRNQREGSSSTTASQKDFVASKEGHTKVDHKDIEPQDLSWSPEPMLSDTLANERGCVRANCPHMECPQLMLSLGRTEAWRRVWRRDECRDTVQIDDMVVSCAAQSNGVAYIY